MEDLRSESEQVVGSKASNLAKVLSTGVRVPSTLVIPSGEVSRVLNESGLRHRVFELSRALMSGGSAEDLLEMERDLKSRFLSLRLPGGMLEEAIASVRGRIRGFLIVRPSPFSSEFSDGDLKGRMPARYCGLSAEELRDAILKVLSESFNLRAVARMLDLGAYPEDVSLALILQEAVVPRSSGVAVCCPAGRSEVLVRSTWGLMDGSSADKFRIGIDLGELMESEINEKRTKFLSTERGLVEVDVDSGSWVMPSLSKEEVRSIASTSLDLSLVFGTPTVVEWMIEEVSGSTFVIQAYKESGKPKIKSLERKVVEILESRASKVVEKVPVQEKPLHRVVDERSYELPLTASRIYIRGSDYLDLADGLLIAKKQAMNIENCDRMILVIEGDEDIDEELLKKCVGSYLVIKPRDISSAREIGSKILSIAPNVKLILYAWDLRSLILSAGVSGTFSGILVPIEVLSEIGWDALRGILRVLRGSFDPILVDLDGSLPLIDFISLLLIAGASGFVLNSNTALKQAQLILRAERRILLDWVKLKLSEGK